MEQKGPLNGELKWQLLWKKHGKKRKVISRKKEETGKTN